MRQGEREGGGERERERWERGRRGGGREGRREAQNLPGREKIDARKQFLEIFEPIGLEEWTTLIRQFVAPSLVTNS